MQRVIKITDNYGMEEKFVKIDDYRGWGIYQEKCPSGYFVSQSWLIKNNKYTLAIYSYNNYCKDEVLDLIDQVEDTGKFGIKAFNKGNGVFIMHNSGQKI